jgi:hypothetical protein
MREKVPSIFAVVYLTLSVPMPAMDVVDKWSQLARLGNSKVMILHDVDVDPSTGDAE